MSAEITQVAEKIIKSMGLLAQTELTYRRADEREFPELVQVYRAVRDQLDAQGCRYLADHELMELSLNPDSLMARTILRTFLSEDETIVVAYYRKRARTGRLLRLLFRGILNLRWIAAPRFFIKNALPRNIFDIETEFDDGSFLITTNAEASAHLAQPTTIDCEYLPVGTSPAVLLARHKARLADRTRSMPSVRPLQVSTADEMLEMQRRQRHQKAAYRATINLIRKEELVSMSGNKVQADAVFAEITRLLNKKDDVVG